MNMDLGKRPRHTQILTQASLHMFIGRDTHTHMHTHIHTSMQMQHKRKRTQTQADPPLPPPSPKLPSPYPQPTKSHQQQHARPRPWVWARTGPHTRNSTHGLCSFRFVVVHSIAFVQMSIFHFVRVLWSRPSSWSAAANKTDPCVQPETVSLGSVL